MDKTHKILRYENINFEFSLHDFKYFHTDVRETFNHSNKVCIISAEEVKTNAELSDDVTKFII